MGASRKTQHYTLFLPFLLGNDISYYDRIQIQTTMTSKESRQVAQKQMPSNRKYTDHFKLAMSHNSFKIVYKECHMPRSTPIVVFMRVVFQ